MSVGQMRQRLTLQSETSVGDGAGGYVLSWSDVATVWADIAPHDGRKIYTAGHLEPRITHELRIRYLSGITADMRATCGTHIFNIHAVIDIDGRKRFLKLLVEEGSPT